MRLQGGLTTCQGLVLSEADRPGYGTHPADDATGVFEQAKDLAVSRFLRNTLEKVDMALGKMDKGTYGLCEQCGDTIDPARLDALPYAVLCVACQTHMEKRAASR